MLLYKPQNTFHPALGEIMVKSLVIQANYLIPSIVRLELCHYLGEKSVQILFLNLIPPETSDIYLTAGKLGHNFHL